MDASIVIAAYNRKDLLEACLRCLDAQTHPADRFEVIVVDDGSTRRQCGIGAGLAIALPLCAA